MYMFIFLLRLTFVETENQNRLNQMVSRARNENENFSQEEHDMEINMIEEDNDKGSLLVEPEEIACWQQQALAVNGNENYKKFHFQILELEIFLQSHRSFLIHHNHSSH